MSEDHAKESPSAAKKWFTCPGSLVLEEGMPQKSSPYAEEGTLAHALSEAMLTNKPLPFSIPEGMPEHVAVYVDHIKDLNGNGTILHVEKVVYVTKHCWGTADAIVWDPITRTLYVRDLKYGAGLAVGARGNLQLKIYALAALLTLGYKAKVVNVGIVQPRIDHEDGLIRSVDYDAVDLMDFHQDLLEAEDRITAAFRDAEHDGKVYGYTLAYWIDKYLVPSVEGCRWCLGASKCPKVKSKAQELAKNVFAPALAYDPKELAETLSFLDILEGWIKNTRSFAYDEAEAGRVAPGFKLVEKRATRKWVEFPNVFQLTGALGCHANALYKPQELRPVGEIEKLAPGKNAAERAAVLEPFTIKESSGHTLVHESDKREPVRLDAKATFSEVKQ